jgi:AcrR family transcriptional regulator
MTAQPPFVPGAPPGSSGPGAERAGTFIAMSDVALDPRVTRSRDAVLRAARELLIEGGPGAVTVDAVVARSGVAKSTIYRHWESRDELLVWVMGCSAPNLPLPAPELGFEPALRQLMRAIGEIFADPEWARMLPALMMLKSHEDGLAHLEEELHQTQLDTLDDVLARGVREGRLAPGYSTEEVAAHLVGPMFFAVVAGTFPIDEAYCDRVVDRFLAGFTS